MAQTHHVASARKTKDGKRPSCCTCHQPIEVGQAYSWNQPSRFSARYQWHQSCKAPRPSTLEPNEKRGAAYAAFEDAYDSIDALREQEWTDPEALLDAWKDIVSTCAEGVREAAEMWRESASNIEDGFGHETEQSMEQNEHGDTYEGVADDIDQQADELDDYEADQWENLQQWVDATLDSMSELLGDCEGSLD